MRPTKSRSWFTRFAKWTAHLDRPSRPRSSSRRPIIVVWAVTGPAVRVQRHLAARHQHRHDDRHVPDGVPHPEHAEPRRRSDAGQARRAHPRDRARQERAARSRGARRRGPRRDRGGRTGDGSEGAGRKEKRRDDRCEGLPRRSREAAEEGARVRGCEGCPHSGAAAKVGARVLQVRNPGVSPGATRSMSGCSGLMRMHAAKWPGLISTSCGSTSRHAATAYGQRVWKRQPDGGLIGDGTSPCEHDPLPLRLDDRIGHRHGGNQRLRVRHQRRVVDAAARRPSSTIFPRYITATRSDVWRIARRSCEMNRYVRLPLALQPLDQVDDLRLDRHVERRDRLVGDDEIGIARRARARCRCAAAGRRRTRADSG